MTKINTVPRPTQARLGGGLRYRAEGMPSFSPLFGLVDMTNAAENGHTGHR
jgi:hypothetical protein